MAMVEASSRFWRMLGLLEPPEAGRTFNCKRTLRGRALGLTVPRESRLMGGEGENHLKEANKEVI